MRRSILIAGFYGRSNAGDEAILQGILTGLREQDANLDLIVVSANPHETSLIHGVRSIDSSDIELLIDEVSHSSLVIVGGGGIFQDYWGVDETSFLTSRQGGISEFGGPILLAHLLDKPSMLYNVGVGPVQTPEGVRSTRFIFSIADQAIVRDEHSLRVLKEIGCSTNGVTVAADPAFCAPRFSIGESISDFLSQHTRPIIGVSVRHWSIGVEQAKWEAEVAGAIDIFLEESVGTILFVPLQDGKIELEDDLRVCRSIRDQIKCSDQAVISTEEITPLERLCLLEDCDLVIGMRLHSLIAAIRGGVPCVALAYDPKVEALMRSVGFREYSFSLDQLQSTDLAEGLRKAFKEHDHLHSHLSHIAGNMAQRAESSAIKAIALMHEGQMSGRDRPTYLSKLILSWARNLGQMERDLDQMRARFQNLEDQFQKALSRAQTAEQHVETTRQQAIRNMEQLESTQSILSDLQHEMEVIRSSRGWKWLNHAWRIVWLIREHTKWLHTGSALLRGLTSRISNLIYGVAGSFRRRARIFLPMPLRALLFSLHASRMVIEDNSQVILYTDRDELFPCYEQRRPLSGVAKQKARVSLVLTVQNEIDTAEALLKTLDDQTRQPDEVIFVDNGSTDGTLELLQEYSAKSTINSKVLVNIAGSLGKCRNVGVDAAKYNVIAMTDFGCLLDPLWLDNLILPFETDQSIEVVAGWYDARASTRIGQRAIHELVPRITDIDPLRFLPATRSIAFLKKSWDMVGGFPEWLTYAGEDTFFTLMLKHLSTRWAFVPDAVVVWHAPDTINSVWQKLSSWTAGDGESGVFACIYWQNIKNFSYGVISLLLWIILLCFSFYMPLLWVFVLLGLFTIMLFFCFLRVVKYSSERSKNLLWIFLGQLARAVGFLRGLSRRPFVNLRRHIDVEGVVFILSGVPIDDTGGGVRAAQLAKELLRRDNLVVFIYRFAKQESIDLQIKNWHPRLLHVHVSDFDWKAFHWEYGELLKHKPILTLVEFPLREFQPLIQSIKRVGGKIVYDLIDDWETSLGGRWYSKTIERKIIDQSDLLIATAPKLVNKLCHVSGREARLIPNAVDLHLFNRRQSYERPKDLPEENPILIYVGALWGDWFDWSLLGRVANAYPEAKIVVIGDYRGKCPLDLPNVHFLGLKAQVDLPAYLIHSDVGIVPWKVDQISQATSPLKVYEYLAMGLPVVAPSLMPLADIPFIFRASSHDEFVAFINKARELQINEEKLDAFLKNNSWQVRMEKLIEWAF